MGSFITDFVSNVWIATIFMIVAGIFIRADKSSLISLTVWTFAQLLMVRIAVDINAVEDIETKRHLWYTTWIVFDAISIWLLLLIHQKLGIARSKLSTFIAVSFFSLLIIQAGRYIDRLVLDTNILGGLYKYCVPAIEVSVSLMALFWLYTTIRTKERVTQ